MSSAGTMLVCDAWDAELPSSNSAVKDARTQTDGSVRRILKFATGQSAFFFVPRPVQMTGNGMIIVPVGRMATATTGELTMEASVEREHNNEVPNGFDTVKDGFVEVPDDIEKKINNAFYIQFDEADMDGASTPSLDMMRIKLTRIAGTGTDASGDFDMEKLLIMRP